MLGVLQHPGSQFWGPAIGGSGNLVVGLYTSPLYVYTIFVIFVISSINQSVNQSINNFIVNKAWQNAHLYKRKIQ